MICDNCKTERLVSDFINNQEFCYKCMYRIKVKKSKEIRIKKTQHCRICKKEIIHQKGLKKRQRTVFCSKECADKAHTDQLKNHWTRKVHCTYGFIEKRTIK